MYEPKEGDPFYYTILIVRYFHYYPLGVKKSNLNYYYAVSVLIRLFSTFMWIECGLHCFFSLKNQIPVDIREDIVGLTVLGNAMFICIMFEINVKRWIRIFIDISDTTKFGTPKNFTEVVKKTNRYSLFFSCYCAVGIAIHVLVKMFDAGRCEQLNKEKGIHEICGTITPLWWPYEEMNPWTKAFINMWQLWSAGCYITPGGIMILLPWEIAEILTSKIHHLKELFEEAFNTEDKDLQRQRLKFCIRYHQEIIRIGNNFSYAVNRLYKHLSIVSAILISCMGTQVLKDYSAGGASYLGGYATTVFLLCRAGQIVSDQTYDIQDAVYNSKWYEVNPKIAKDIQLVVLRCQKPVFLEAAPFGVWNYNILIIIIKSSYSYLTLMN